MTLDPAYAAAERTAAAQRLIARAQAEIVDLVTVSALDLCVLDGPRQPLFEERVAHAWVKLGERQRRKVMEEVIASMLQRGLLIDDHPLPGARQHVSNYSLKPELGLMLAARCRPAFVVVAVGESPGLRPLNLFALGDQSKPVQGIVAEVPTELPPERASAYPGTRKLGPLGWIYRYVLVSPVNAAEIIARWTISPPPQTPMRYLVSAYRPDHEHPVGYHLGVRGDGTWAVVDGPGIESTEPTGTSYDLEGLSGLMLSLLSAAAR